jgi:hypothetical protein
VTPELAYVVEMEQRERKSSAVCARRQCLEGCTSARRSDKLYSASSLLRGCVKEVAHSMRPTADNPEQHSSPPDQMVEASDH